MIARTFLLFHLSFYSLVLLGQGTGMLFDDISYGQMQTSAFEGSKGSQLALDTTLKVDLKPYCPEVINQGDISSCVGWSCGYEAMSIVNAVKNGWKGETKLITDNAFSAMFIFNQITQDNCGGSRLADAMDLLIEKGNLLSSEFDSDINSCARMPSSDDMTRAGQNRIIDYTALFPPDAAERVKVDQVKLALMEQRPVVVGMELRKNFQGLVRGTKFWWPDAGNTDLFGGHAMVVVGFDEGKQAFELMNTWGKTWGNNGFIWIKYNEFAKFCRYAIDLVFDPGEIATRNILYGKLDVKRYMGRVNNEMLFSSLNVRLEDGKYKQQLSIENGPVLFQMVARQFSTNAYLYVVGETIAGELELHWPKDSRIDKYANDQSQSACLRSSNWAVPLPEKYKTFGIEEEREESIYLVVSKRPLTQSLSNCFGYCRKYRKSFRAALDKYEGEAIIPAENVELEAEEMSFYADSRVGDVVVIQLITSGISGDD